MLKCGVDNNSNTCVELICFLQIVGYCLFSADLGSGLGGTGYHTEGGTGHPQCHYSPLTIKDEAVKKSPVVSYHNIQNYQEKYVYLIRYTI